MERLGELLDEESRLLELRRSQLDSLCGAVVDRDDEAVGRLLEQIEQARALQTSADAKLQSVRGHLAKVLGVPPSGMRLSVLVDRLEGPVRYELARRRERIMDLAARLQREHLRAVMLLNECARINRLLLESLLPGAETVTTYGRGGGRADWRGGASLLDAES
jgi:flagellar biosynthesis/type III secretory pathway chaperone